MSKPLPPLNSIRAFEVAARHLNFSRASEEIGVTPGAISKQILLLEDFIGAKLFERLPGELTLTPSGYALKMSVEPAFDMLSRAFERYSRRSPRSNVCRVSTVASFAGQVLVPRLDQFKAELPHIELEILTSHRLVDFAREEIDFSVRYGQGAWDDVISSELAKGELVLVCAPDYLTARNQEDLETFVRASRRIQLYSNDEWQTWAQQNEIDLSGSPNTFIIEDSSVAISATQAGQGIALLPEILARPSLNDGKLVRITNQALPWHQSYFITHAPNAEQNPITRDVLVWLRKVIAAE